MKTAIAISDNVFKLSEKLAKQLKVSRSKIFAVGFEKSAEKYDENLISEKLNGFYENKLAEIDSTILKMAGLSLPDDE